MSAWRNNPGTGFDAETFRKLVARFDSNHAGEAETAFRKAMAMCGQSDLRFCDAASEAYGRGSDLEGELAEARELLGQRERQGAALADARDRLEQEFSAYRRQAERELARLRQAGRPAPGNYCRACEWKRAALAVAAGFPIAKLWFSHSPLPAFEFASGDAWQKNAIGGALVASPLLGVLVRWWWLAFKRKYSWVSRRDNDIYRRMKARWNALLQRLALK
jgi:hypothetical protein